LAAKILRIFRSFFLEKNEPRKARQRKSIDLPGFHFAKRFISLASLGKSFAAACAAAAPFKRQVPSLFQGTIFLLLNTLCHFECPGEAGMYREGVFI